MDDGEGFGRNDEKIKNFDRYKRQKFIESYDHQSPEEITHIEEYRIN